MRNFRKFRKFQLLTFAFHHISRTNGIKHLEKQKAHDHNLSCTIIFLTSGSWNGSCCMIEHTEKSMFLHRGLNAASPRHFLQRMDESTVVQTKQNKHLRSHTPHNGCPSLDVTSTRAAQLTGAAAAGGLSLSGEFCVSCQSFVFQLV